MRSLVVAISIAVALGAPGGAIPSASAPAESALQSSGAKPAQPAPTPADLDRLLAPIALYPDALLGQILL